ncbi:hypothetical protein CO661_00430 [Sinorhizobium fredii]|uniref:Uncharacterized protein n=1 Tax=Rhizobium fredii TaxID=380 RepID=A0A2A6M6D2_RHIFR|nr:hypothetical protein CO661_00430 [Sinorhizobium fredii]
MPNECVPNPDEVTPDILALATQYIYMRKTETERHSYETYEHNDREAGWPLHDSLVRYALPRLEIAAIPRMRKVTLREFG